MDFTELSGDLLRGAQAIGEVLYGPDDPHAARKVYNNKDRLPVFTLEGSTILLALRSRLAAHLHAKSSEKEERIAATKPAAIKADAPKRRQVRHQRAVSSTNAAA
jgi:hypothetical protein